MDDLIAQQATFFQVKIIINYYIYYMLLCYNIETLYLELSIICLHKLSTTQLEKRLNTIPHFPVYGLRMPIYGSGLSQYGKIRDRIQAFFAQCELFVSVTFVTMYVYMYFLNFSSQGVDYCCVSDNYWLGLTKPCVTYGLR